MNENHIGARISLASTGENEYEICVDDSWTTRYKESSIVLQCLAKDIVYDPRTDTIEYLQEN